MALGAYSSDCDISDSDCTKSPISNDQTRINADGQASPQIEKGSHGEKTSA